MTIVPQSPVKTSNMQTGWMVMGIDAHSMSPKGLRVPVIAVSAESAMMEASAKTPGFHPVGAMSLAEILEDVRRIRAHCASSGLSL